MRDTVPTAAPFVPATDDLDRLRAGALDCRGCDLYRDATQTVFGEGPPAARVVMVGEQPGDIEDRRGAPFVGPAGKLLDRAMVDAGLDRAATYVTNAVKHFKHRPAAPGKRRIHQTPDRTEIVACRPWLVAEFAALRPRAVVVLGATAAQALFGPGFRVTRSRGVRLPWPDSASHPDDFAGGAGDGAFALATVHPSAVLRSDDRDAAYAGFVADLRVVAETLSTG
ncbi:MAG: uracil-DNA glycosylase [Micromonosporaceae bacterium]|nr:uracil-DNA glycosylase [Micromonosporaceae bacterium]